MCSRGSHVPVHEGWQVVLFECAPGEAVYQCMMVNRFDHSFGQRFGRLAGGYMVPTAKTQSLELYI